MKLFYKTMIVFVSLVAVAEGAAAATTAWSGNNISQLLLAKTTAGAKCAAATGDKAGTDGYFAALQTAKPEISKFWNSLVLNTKDYKAADASKDLAKIKAAVAAEGAKIKMVLSCQSSGNRFVLTGKNGDGCKISLNPAKYPGPAASGCSG